jgi:transcriptional regulator with XRE-family HTH domain
MNFSKKFAEWIKADVKKSQLCIELNISRSTLNRWLSKSPEQFGRLDRLEIISKLSGIDQNEVFISNESTLV